MSIGRSSAVLLQSSKCYVSNVGWISRNRPGGRMAKLAVVVLGNRKAGKSTTWNELFGRTVRTGSELRELELSDDGGTLPVFLVSGSPEERRKELASIVEGDERVILCSLQYTERARDSIRFLVDSGYRLYVQWLNPGRHDAQAAPDVLGFVDFLLHHGATLSVRDGREPPRSRVREIRDFLTGWASGRRITAVV